MNLQKIIDTDINDNLCNFYPNVELWNHGDSYIMYEITQNDMGLSHSEIDKLSKKGLKLFSIYMKTPIDGNSQCSMRFFRKLTKKELQR